jgi:hypothetical protein
MQPEILVAFAAVVLAAIGAFAAMFGADTRDAAENDWHHDTRSRAQI